ncbi:MAG: STT3 domain-containing protein, partial [Halobacteria archaeon]|nr:STT3 domain-containing protein [Halobacteria archaeon]
MSNGEPLLVTTLSFVSDTLDSSGVVLALYPVLSAVLVAVLIYLTATSLTRDRRVGVASALFFAVIPASVVRTALGFADHHPFDYIWLALTVLFLVILSKKSCHDAQLRNPRTWLISLLLGVVVAFQVLSWDNSPLLIAPIGLYAVIDVLSEYNDKTSGDGFSVL